MRFPVLRLPLLTRAAFFLILISTTISAQEMSFQSVIDGLDSTSSVLVQASRQLNEARAQYTASRAIPNPTVFAEGQTLSDHGFTERENTLGIEQSMGFLWSQTPMVEARRFVYESELTAYETIRRDVVAEIIRNLSLLRDLQQLEVLLDTVQQTAEDAMAATAARRQQGDVSDYDAQRMEAELVQLQNRKFALLQEQNQIAQRLTELSGYSAEVLDNLSVPIIPDPPFVDENEAMRYAQAHSLKLRQSEITTQAMRKALLAAKRNQLPDLVLGIARKTADPEFSGWLWQAGIEIPVWGQRRSERNLARAQWKNAEYQQHTQARITEQETLAAMQQWRLLKNIPIASKSATFDNSQLNLHRGIRLYMAGEFGSLELVDALRSVLDAMQANLELHAALLTANLEVRKVTGLAIWE